MQAVRYLCSIPHKDGVKHCVQAALSVIKDNSVDIYSRFYFFANQEKYLRLDDHVCSLLFPLFFKYGLEQGPVVVPFELMVLTAKQIFRQFGMETTIRQDALDWLLNVIENQFETVQTRKQAIGILLEVGADDEYEFAEQALQTLCEENDVDSEEQLIMEPQEHLARDILRYLQTHHIASLTEDYPLEVIGQSRTKQECDDMAAFRDGCKELVCNGIPFTSIFSLICKQIDTFLQEEPHLGSECLQRLLNEVIYAESGMDVIFKCLTIFDGLLTPREFILEGSFIEYLRNEVFGTINGLVYEQNTGIRDAIYDSLNGNDKSAANEFLNMNDYIQDEIWEKFKNKCTRKEFDIQYENIVKEWLQ